MTNKIYRVKNDSKAWTQLKKYWDAGKIKLDLDGVIGESGAYKTRDFVFINGHDGTLSIAKELFYHEKQFLAMPHDYIPDKYVFVWKGCPYMKLMISGGFLWIDIHA